jgi:hypothetical protein
VSSSGSSSGLVGRRNVAVFDQRRNTSRVWAVPPTARPDAMRALERLRHDDPELVSWIEAGAPRLTDAEHVARFGEPYAASLSRRGRGRST